MDGAEGVREKVIDRKRGQNVWRETWAGGKLMEGETYGGREREEDGRKVQYGERVDGQRERERRKN